MTQQIEFTLRAYPRRIHLVTGEVMRQLPALPETGLLNLLIKHTSAALALNERRTTPTRAPTWRHHLRQACSGKRSLLSPHR